MGVFPIMIEKCDLDGTLSPSQVIDMIPAPMTDQVREAAFDRLWRTLRDQHLGPKDIPYWPPDKCPFPGLMAFNEEYAPVYFGRETERDQVLRVLNQMRDQGVPRLLMITGGSGSGKSSLVRAGVLPWLNHALEANRWLTLPTFRFNETSEQHTLLGRLAESLVAHFPPDVRPDWKRLRDLFDSEEIALVAQSFADTVRDLNQTCNLVERTLVVVIDQFEELLSNQSRPSHLRFLQFVQKLLSGSDGRILMIGTLRSDYLDVYERHPLALQPPYFHTYRVPPFPKERVNDVIVQPASRVGVVFSNELLERIGIS
jgi:energy-coupling factor transporter ATP-binding protein EcfA2